MNNHASVQTASCPTGSEPSGSEVVRGDPALTIQNVSKVVAPPEPLDPALIEFGTTCTPNFFTMKYVNNRWESPCIAPVQLFKLHPAAIVLQYSQSIFEGLKAFRQVNGRIVLFRPEMNARRFNRSAARLNMPQVDEKLFVEATIRLVENERYFVPPAPGSLYIRPTMIGVEPCIGVRSSHEFIFYILTLPAGAYFREVTSGAGSIDVLVSESACRACPGGTGSVKTGGNYAASLDIIARAKRFGCAQVLFLDAVGRTNVEEMGGMNICFISGGELITPPLSETILPGITRDAILRLASDLDISVKEVPIDIRNVVADIQAGRITEAIACGTAASVTGIGTLHFENGRVIPVGNGSPGPITNILYDRLAAIQYGRSSDERGWMTEVCRLESARSN
jgi:branched-chain amino acid aminotransferase